MGWTYLDPATGQMKYTDGRPPQNAGQVYPAASNPYLNTAPAAPAPTAQPQQAASGGGNSFQDLYQMAVQSPWYQQGAAASQAASAADKASGKSAIQQMLIQFGIVPEGFTDQFGAADATTRSLAEANTTSGISAYARMRQALADANRDASRRLAARGLRRSGARGYRLRRNQLGFDQGYADSISKLLGDTRGVYSGFANNEYTRSMNLAGLLNTAIGNMSSFYTPQTTQSLGDSFGTNYFQTPGTYTGGAQYATRSENPNINPIFWFK